jgi:O-antigen/teichoic acid export membrane protein
MKRAILVFTTLGMTERLMPFILLPFITRSMSPSEYGMVSVLTSSTALIAAVLGGSVEQAVFRWTAIADTTAANVLSAARWWLLAWAPLVCAGTGATIVLLNQEILQVSPLLWLLELCAIGLTLFPIYYSLPRLRAARELARFTAVAGTSIATSVIGKTILVIVLGEGVRGWVTSDILNAALTSVVALCVVTRTPKPSSTLSGSRTLLRFASPLIPHVSAFWALNSLSRPLLAALMPLSSVAIYSVALSAANLGPALLSEVNRGVLPDYSRAEPPYPGAKLQTAMRIQLFAPFIVAICISGASPLLTYFVLPPEYAPVTAILSLLSLISVGYGIYLLFINFVVQVAGVTTWSWIASLAGAFTIFLGIFVGAESGLIYVAMVNVLGFLCMATVAFILVKTMKLRVSWRLGGIGPANISVLLPTVLISAVFPVFWSGTVSIVVSIIALIIVMVLMKFQLNWSATRSEDER